MGNISTSLLLSKLLQEHVYLLVLFGFIDDEISTFMSNDIIIYFIFSGS